MFMEKFIREHLHLFQGREWFLVLNKLDMITNTPVLFYQVIN